MAKVEVKIKVENLSYTDVEYLFTGHQMNLDHFRIKRLWEAWPSIEKSLLNIWFMQPNRLCKRPFMFWLYYNHKRKKISGSYKYARETKFGTPRKFFNIDPVSNWPRPYQGNKVVTFESEYIFLKRMDLLTDKEKKQDPKIFQLTEKLR